MTVRAVVTGGVASGGGSRTVASELASGSGTAVSSAAATGGGGVVGVGATVGTGVTEAEGDCVAVGEGSAAPEAPDSGEAATAIAGRRGWDCPWECERDVCRSQSGTAAAARATIEAWSRSPRELVW